MATTKSARWLGVTWTQERIVLSISAILFAVFALTLNRFAAADNILSIVQSVSILGILGIAMALVVIGRGIDLSLVAVMVIPAGWILLQVTQGVDLWQAALSAVGFAIVVGLLNGWLVAYAEVPAIFATFAIGTAAFGFGQYFLVPIDVVSMPAALNWLAVLGLGRVGPIPNTIVAFAAVALLAMLFLRHTRRGRFIFAVGDNPQTARITGVPVRPIIVLQYVLAALIAAFAGIVLAGTINSVNTRLFQSTMLYDVVLVVVLGGIGLNGGKGGIHNVLIGTILIGILLNGMTIMDLSYTAQNLVKSAVLLVAIVIDGLLNPRDEQTSQQGDI